MKSPFEGDLIRLRAREPEDEALLHAWFNDTDVTEHLTIRYPLSHLQEARFIEDTSAIAYGNASFGVETLADGRLIGGVGLQSASPENRSAVLGIEIGETTFWDGGYGSDTMRTVCRFGFEMMNLHRIELEVYAANVRAQHVYEKIGFVVEGRRREALYKFGRYQDVVVMGLIEGELR